MNTKTCTNCKYQAPADAKYCSNCGHPFLKKVKVSLNEVLNSPAKKLSKEEFADKPFASKSLDEKLNALNIKLDLLLRLFKPKK